MKFITRMATCLSVSILLIGGASLSVVASDVGGDDSSISLRTTYSTNDINRDGSVDIMDYIRLNNYFFSNRYTGSNYILDANRNHIISAADSQCVMAGVVGNSYGCTVSPLSYIFNAGTTSYNQYPSDPDTKTFIKHTYSTGDDDDYTLELNENFNLRDSLDDLPRLTGIIGTDDRVTYANEGIVCIHTSGGYATGFIVDDHVIATVAHEVFDCERTGSMSDKWHTNPVVYLSTASGGVSSIQCTVVEAHIPEDYAESTNFDSQYDYALLTVQNDLSDYYHFNIGIPYNMYSNDVFTSYFGDYDINVAGFSRYPVGSSTPSNVRRIYKGTGKIKTPRPSTNKLCYTSDVTVGVSGGPVFVQEDYYTYSTPFSSQSYSSVSDLTVIGIQSGYYGSYNASTLFDAYTLYFYKNNPNISY